MGLNTLNLRTCKAVLSANMSIPNNAATALIFDGTTIDNLDSMWAVANPSRITFNRAGIYLVGAQYRLAAAATGEHRLQIRVNGAGLIADQLAPVAVLGINQNVCVTSFFKAGDYIEALVFQNSGGALNCLATAADESPSMFATLVRPFIDYSAASQAL